MPEMTLTEAAQWSGKDRTTLFKAIQKGRISGRKTDDGQWMIDPAELARIYPNLKTVNAINVEANGSTPYRAMDDAMAALRQQIASLEADKADLRTERDRLLSVVESQTRLITHITAQPAVAEPTSKPSLLRRLFGAR
jgi:hypothetical protein